MNKINIKENEKIRTKMQLIKNNFSKVLLVLCIIIIVILSIFLFYLKQQSKVVIIPQYNFFVEDVGNATITKVAQEWTKQYMAQYTQKYLNLNKRLKNINITNVQVLDVENNIVQVDFTANKLIKNSKYFFENNISRVENEDGSIECNFVIELVKVNNYEYGNIYYIKRRINSAQYDIELYKTSGQEEQDDKYYTFKNEKDYKDKFRQCTYKIENGEVYVTYDYSKTFKKVNLNFSSVVDISDYELKEGMYQISEDLTVIGAVKSGKQVIAYSTDSGNTFSQLYIDPKFGDIMHLYFLNKDIGYAVTATDYAMGRAFIQIVKTIDGGKTWQLVNSKGSDYRTNSKFLFLNQNIGFIAEPSADGASATLYRSDDGFNTFKKVIIPVQTLSGSLDNDTSKWSIIYDTPQIPYLEDNTLFLVVEQGSDGDYRGGNTKAVYKSTNEGFTWKFIEEYEQESMPWEG